MKYKHNGLVRIGSFNCKTSPELCQEYGIRKYPSFLMFEQGKLLGSYVGEPTTSGFQHAIDEFLQRSNLKGINRSQRRLPAEIPLVASEPHEALGELECLNNKHALCWKYNKRSKTCSLQKRCIELQCKPDRMLGFLHTGN